MKIMLIGARGRMGQEVKNCIDREKDEVVCEIDCEKKFMPAENADVIIDFSTSENRQEYIDFAIKEKIPYACFSTNISKDDIKRFGVLSASAPTLLCANASLGFETMFDATKNALEKIKTADVALMEFHHKHKKDKPSGSAVALENLIKKCGFSCQTEAFRVANERGKHIIKIFMEDEVLEISHQVFSRKVFALGAIEMARDLTKRKPGLYEKYKT